MDRNGYERHDDVEVRFPFGGSIRASGRMVVIVLLVLGLVALGVWHDWKSTQQNTAVIEALQGVAYVLTLSEAERKRLRLEMPDSLRARINRERLNREAHE